MDKARATQDTGVSAKVQALPAASTFLPGAEAGHLTGPTQGAPSGFGGRLCFPLFPFPQELH